MKKLIILLAACLAVILALITRPRSQPTPSPNSDPDSHFQASDGDAGEAVVESPASRVAQSKERAKSNLQSARQLPPDQWLRDWQLTERSGEIVSSQSLRGKPYLASFFYSTCPSICVKQNDQLRLLQQRFRQLPIQLVSISCDPEMDSPEKLLEYAKRFEADPKRWWFCTGEWDYLRKISTEIFFHGLRRPKEHIERFLLMDAEGNLVAAYDWHSPEELKILEQDVQALLQK